MYIKKKFRGQPEPASRYETCMRRQLPKVVPPEELAAFDRELSQIPGSNERALLTLERYGDRIRVPPGPEESKLLDDIAAKVEACRQREISQGTLIVYLARFAIPQLAAYDDEDM